jgi:hypothetical protein
MPPPGTEETGQPPTTRTDNLQLAAAELAPHLSLQRIEANARFVLATVTVVGGLLTGLGVLGDTAVSDHPAWALPSLLAAAISVAVAVWATVGSNDEVQVDDLDDVDRYYTEQIRQRGKLARIAGSMLAIALLLAVVPAIRAAATSDAPPPPELHFVSDAHPPASVGATRP